MHEKKVQEKMEERTLSLDAQTAKDLEVFSSASGGQTLFDYCNQTKTEGGATVLRRRMNSPWCRRVDILETQAAIAAINQTREQFNRLQALAYTASRVEYYLHEILPVAVQENPVEFALEVLSIRMNHQSHYYSIARGVQFCTRLITSLKSFVDELKTDTLRGELKTLLDEVVSLLERPRFDAVTILEAGDWPWKILRLDQTFRLHNKAEVSRLLELIYEVDALIALADTTIDHNMTMPAVLEGPTRIEAENLVHPFLSHPVGNPVALDQEQRVMFLSGPNMAGKTTYLRSVATALYFGHLGMGVPASSFGFVPVRHLFSSISLSDNLQDGVSYFRAEALRVKTVASAIAAGESIVAVMDEPFKGTNVKDAYDASLAILERFSGKLNCLFLFSSHLIELSEDLSHLRQIDCRYFDARESAAKLEFDYRLQNGTSDQRLGMRVLKEEGIFELLDQGPKESAKGPV